jgi:hypothetical protein
MLASRKLFSTQSSYYGRNNCGVYCHSYRPHVSYQIPQYDRYQNRNLGWGDRVHRPPFYSPHSCGIWCNFVGFHEHVAESRLLTEERRTYPTSYISYLPQATVNFFTAITPEVTSGGQTCSADSTRDVDIPLSNLQPSDLIFESPTAVISDNGYGFYALPTQLVDYISRLVIVSQTNVGECIAAGFGGGASSGLQPVAHTTVAILTEVHEQVVLTGPNSQRKWTASSGP